jgi:hypothetical protein
MAFAGDSASHYLRGGLPRAPATQDWGLHRKRSELRQHSTGQRSVPLFYGELGEACWRSAVSDPLFTSVF